jgi:phosphohistidine phosphatase SixA
MQLILQRHGEPQPPHEDVDDSDRSLTRRGRRQAARSAQALVAGKIIPTIIWTSPYLRTTQTAEMMAKMIRPAPPWRDRVAGQVQPMPPVPTPPTPTVKGAQAPQPVTTAPVATAEVVPVVMPELTHGRAQWHGKRGRANLDAIIAKLAALPADATVAIVGHHALLEALAHRLTSRPVPRVSSWELMPMGGAIVLSDEGTPDKAMVYRETIDPRTRAPRVTVI